MYADANATYPVDPKHYDAVAARLKQVDGNPSSIHARGREAKIALEAARASLARMLGARGPEVVFTSGATEANNMVVQGVAWREAGSAPVHAVIGATEHSAIKEPAKLFEARGRMRVDVAPVRRDGSIDLDALLALVRPDTALVCLMHANNETGVVHPVAELAAAVKKKAPAAHVHTDAVQTLGKVDMTWLAASALDSAAFSAHKIGGFKGVGALYLRPGTKLAQLISGGGQERGRRPGTENMPGILSFGLRCDELRGKEAAWSEAMRLKRDALLAELAALPGVVVHGDVRGGLPNTVNFHVEGVPGDDILLNLDLAGVQASSGSACSSGSARPSPVLMAMGYDEWVALNSVRVSFPAEGDGAAVVSVLVRTLKDVSARVHPSPAPIFPASP